MKRVYWLLLVSLFIFTACKEDKKQDNKSVTTSVKFNLPDIPVMLTSPDDRARYLALHYWDKFNFKDTTLVHLPDITEQAIVNFMDIISMVDLNIADSAIATTFRSASSDKIMLHYFWDTFERYWNNPNSPMRNENFFIAMCRAVGKLSNIDEAIKSNSHFKLKNTLKNRVGQKAANFTYTTNYGQDSSMQSISSPYTVLFFYNPDCETCVAIKEKMVSSTLLNRLLSERKIKILAIYTDEDIEAWKRYQSQIPDSWINSYDKEQKIQGKELYDLRAMPTIYLLDKNKNVILKDVSIDNLEYFLENK